MTATSWTADRGVMRSSARTAIDTLLSLAKYIDSDNDIADGGPGDDIFATFWFSDSTIITGTGSDKIVLLWGLNGGHHVTVTDFTAGPGGDVIDIEHVLNDLSGLDGNPFAAGFLRLLQDGTATQLQVDQNGPTGGANWTTIVT